MGVMFRVSLSSQELRLHRSWDFFLLYKDYKIAQESIYNQVRDIYESLDGRYEALNKRTAALENLKAVEAATPMEGSE